MSKNNLTVRLITKQTLEPIRGTYQRVTVVPTLLHFTIEPRKLLLLLDLESHVESVYKGVAILKLNILYSNTLLTFSITAFTC